jgi:hypothetical protein
MAILNVTEYATVMTIANGAVQIPLGEPLATYDIAVGAGSVQGAVLNVATRVVRLNTDVTCRVRLGVNPTAGAADSRFAAAQTEFWGVAAPGMRVATITSA